jgi:hypothetical protein
MAGGPRALSQEPGAFHAKLPFNEDRYPLGTAGWAAALAYACQANPTYEAAANAACAWTRRFQQSFCQTSANEWHLTASLDLANRAVRDGSLHRAAGNLSRTAWRHSRVKAQGMAIEAHTASITGPSCSEISRPVSSSVATAASGIGDDVDGVATRVSRLISAIAGVI